MEWFSLLSLPLVLNVPSASQKHVIFPGVRTVSNSWDAHSHYSILGLIVSQQPVLHPSVNPISCLTYTTLAHLRESKSHEKGIKGACCTHTSSLGPLRLPALVHCVQSLFYTGMVQREDCNYRVGVILNAWCWGGISGFIFLYKREIIKVMEGFWPKK